MKTHRLTSLLSATLLLSLTACDGGSDSSQNNNKNYAKNQTIGYTFDTETINNETNVIQNEYAIKDGVPITKSISLTNKSFKPTSKVTYRLTNNALYRYVGGRDSNGLSRNADQLITKYDGTTLVLSDKTDPDLKQTITLENKDISGKAIYAAVNLGSDATVGKVAQIPSTQNMFGGKQSCKITTKKLINKDYIELKNVIANNQSKANFDSFLDSNITGTKISSTWQGVNWAVSKDSTSGFAFFDNKIWQMTYYDKDKTSYTLTPAQKAETKCEFINKAQAEFVAKAIKTAYGIK